MKNKVLLVFILFSILMLFFITPVNASFNPDYYTPGTLEQDDYVVPFEFAGNILYYISVIGIVVSIVMTMVLGFRYMFASVEAKAEYKKTMIPMLVGAFLLFASSSIVSIIYSLVSQANI